MALFGKDRSRADQLPAEVQEYYQAERRERTGLAWLLALATLAVTIALAAALFFGGRWLYTTLRSDDTKKTARTAGTSQAAENTQDDAQNGAQDDVVAGASGAEDSSAGAADGADATTENVSDVANDAGQDDATDQQGMSSTRTDTPSTNGDVENEVAPAGADDVAGGVGSAEDANGVAVEDQGQAPNDGAEVASALVNTGPADVVGIFVAVTVAGVISHSVLYRRYNS
ncbi:hypothetical protein CR970_02450 [Candidatus Saccharibacteria bacterium]|nr:MAG: hypothetical protein CR970_02450 [Candidatus Saccharibacteria bacterium]